MGKTGDSNRGLRWIAGKEYRDCDGLQCLKRMSRAPGFRERRIVKYVAYEVFRFVD